MIKKITMIAVIVSILLTSFAHAEEMAAQAADINDNEVAFLKALQVIDTGVLTEFDLDANATRANMAFMTARMIYQEVVQLPDSGAGFLDVDANHWAANEIYFCKSNGYINGVDSQNFKPDEEVTQIQAIKSIISALGYDVLAQNKGGFPAGYLMIASEINVLVSGSAQSAITNGQLAKLIYKALNAPLLKQTSFGNNIQYTKDKNITALTEYHGIYKNKGIVYDDGVSALDRKTSISKNEISIKLSNGEIYTYYKNDVKTNDLLGLKAEYFFRESKKDEDDLFYIHAIDNDILTVYSEDIISYTNKGYTYKDKRDNTTIRLSDNFDVIYNNLAYMPSMLEEMVPANGKIKLIDQNKDSIYDAVFIYDYATIFVESKFEGEDFYNIRDIYGNSMNISSANVDLRVILKGEEVEFDAIDKYQVASVAISKDSLITIYLSDAYIDGVLTEMSEDGWIIDGKRYDLTLNLKNNKADYQKAQDTVKYGEMYTFRFDIEGKIAGVEEDVLNSDDYVYMIATDYKPGGISDITFKVLSRKGEFEILKAKSTLTFNGTRMRSQDYMAALFGGKTQFPAQIAMITRTKDGYISTMDIPQSKGSGGNVIEEYTDRTVTYKKTNRIFSGYFSVSDSSVIFFVRNEDLEDKEKYLALKPDDLSDTSYSASVYNMKNNGIAKAVVLKGGAGTQTIGNDDLMCVVSKVAKTIDKAGQLRTKVYFYQKGILTSYLGTVKFFL